MNDSTVGTEGFSDFLKTLNPAKSLDHFFAGGERTERGYRSQGPVAAVLRSMVERAAAFNRECTLPAQTGRERPTMKKVLLADDLKSLLTEKSSFLDRADFAVFTASTNEEMLKIHRKEKADLIVTRLDLPGIKSEDPSIS
jgi:PleD family two-component response regulator